MSKLTIDNIDTLTAGDTHVLLSCLPKAWEHVNCGLKHIWHSHNVSSLTFNATGKHYTVFATAFGAADYQSVTPCSGLNTTSRPGTMSAVARGSDTGYSTTQVEVVRRTYTSSSGAFIDHKDAQHQFWGDF